MLRPVGRTPAIGAGSCLSSCNQRAGPENRVTPGPDIYRDLAAQAVVILLSNAAKTFLVAFFILFIVDHLATRHLLDIAASAASVTPGAELPPLRLRRLRVEGDELDQLVDALNAMRERLRQHAIELGNANARMAAILDNIPDLAWVEDANGRFIAVNRAVAAANGLAEPHDMIGKTDFDAHPPELAFPRKARSAFSPPSTRRNPPAWGWGCRSPVRSSKHMAPRGGFALADNRPPYRWLGLPASFICPLAMLCRNKALR
ncbi:PAS domain-containing protein [Paraburkholderia sp. UCT31]|nr:PAS domain-containing protein [Paraburkholderia sp. UCT31]